MLIPTVLVLFYTSIFKKVNDWRYRYGFDIFRVGMLQITILSNQRTSVKSSVRGTPVSVIDYKIGCVDK